MSGLPGQGRRALILIGGIFHDFAGIGASLAALLQEIGLEAVIAEDMETAVAAAAPWDLIVIAALRWRMQNAEKYAPYRAQWAMSPSAAFRRRIAEHVIQGRGLLGLHTASICFDDWPEWGALLGAQWVWGRSSHPPVGPVTVRRTETANAITDGAGEFAVEDELYQSLAVEADMQPLLQGAVPASPSPSPVLWAREAANRTVYNALGHSPESVEAPVHRRILKRSAAWALGADDDVVRRIV